MPEDVRKPARPSWRGENGGSAGKSGGSGYRWNRERAEAALPRKASQSARFFRALAALLVCCATIVGLILLISNPKKPDIVVVGAGYAENLAVPHNVWGLNLLDRLTWLSGASTSGIQAGLNTSAYALHGAAQGPSHFLLADAGEAWTAKAKRIRSLGKDSRNRPLIVVMTMHGAVDANGQPYLLPEDARPGDAPLKVTTVVDTLASIGGEKKLKLLILDPTSMTDAWHFGVLRNDFATALQSIKIPKGKNVWILASSAPLQRSWVDESEKLTAFGHSLVKGLGGGAVRSKANITLGSLARYVGKSTHDWVARNRNSDQSALLIGDQGAATIPGAGEKAGKILALADAIELVRSIKVTPTAADAATEGEVKANKNALAQIAAAWEAVGRLERRADGEPWKVRETAASYAPIEWAMLRESVVRREELQRAGFDALVARGNIDIGLPTKLDQSIANLPKTIAKARVVPLKRSGGATLPMLAAAGEPAPEPDGGRRGISKKLLNTATADFVKAWNAAKIPPRDFFDGGLALLGEHEDLDPGELADADDLLTHGAISTAGLTPLEIRFLSMLRHNLSETSGPGPSLLSRAIAVRRHAERVALGIGSGADYANVERLTPWIRTAVDEADGARRVAEDLLYSTDARDHAGASVLFDTAESGYTEAESRADVAGQALALRDAALADLPPLTRWATRRHATVSGPTKTTTGSLDHLESLWSAVRALDDQLEMHPGGDVKALHDTSARALEAYRKVLSDYDRVVNGPARKNTLDPLEERLARSVPVADRRDFRGVPDPKPSAGNAPALDATELTNRAAEHARGQARMALASLGPKLYALAVDNYESFDLLSKNIKQGGPKQTLEAVKSLGPRIGQALNSLPEDIRRESSADMKLTGPADAEASLGIMAAARLARLVAPWQTLKPADPVGLARKRRLVDLLKRQAERSYVDHYWNGQEPLYPDYVAAYLADAAVLGQELIGESLWNQQIKPAHDKMLASLQATDAMSLHGPADPVWTSEREYPLRFTLESRPVPGSPPVAGRPVAWVDPPKNGAVTVDPTEHGDRLAMVLGEAQGSHPLEILLRSARHNELEARPPTRPEREETPLVSRLFFRGRVEPGEVPLRMLHLPEIRLTSGPRTNQAKLLVRAAEEFGGRNTAIALVFDNSKSMNWCPAGDNTRSKYKVAYEVLEEVLRDIRLRNDTNVSLWMYGNGQPGAEGKDDMGWCSFQTANWDAKTSTEKLLASLKDAQGNLQGTWDTTPLITTMRLARDALLQSGREKKLLIILTDGRDSFIKPPDDKRVVQQEFDRKGIVLNVVLFRTGVEESRQAKNELVQKFVLGRTPEQLKDLQDFEQAAEETLSGVKNFQPPGAFFPAKDRAELKRHLEGFLAQRPRLTLRTDKDQPIAGADDADLRVQPRETPIDKAWVVPDGFMRVRIENEGWIWVRTVRDEVLVLDVSRESDRYRVIRSLASDSNEVLRSQTTAEAPEWRLAVARAIPGRLTGTSLATSLEEAGLGREPQVVPSIGGKEKFIRQIPPRSAWFELAGPEGAATRPFHVEFRRLADCAAPTWETYLPRAPIGAAFAVQPSTLTVWFREDASGALKRIRKDDLVVGNKLDEAGTILEFLGVETHFVPKAGDDPAAREQAECLTIRLKCPPGTLSRVDSLELGDGTVVPPEEQRFYRSGDRVTALYWPCTPDGHKTLKSVTIESVDGLKKESGTRKLEMKLDTSWLGEPDQEAAAQP